MPTDASFEAGPEWDDGPSREWDAMYEPHDPLDYVIETQNMLSVFAAQQYERVETMRREVWAAAAFAGRAPTDVIERSMRLQLAAALSMTEAAAGALMGQAEALSNRYPSVLESLSHAGTTKAHAAHLVEALDAVEPEFREQLIAPALGLAEELPFGTFRRKLRTLIELTRAVTLTQRYEEALTRRRLVHEPGADVLGSLFWQGAGVEAWGIWNRITAIAKIIAAIEGETRTLDQIRADVFAELLIGGTTEGMPEEARGIRATVAVTVPVLALLEGLDEDEGGTGHASAGIGDDAHADSCPDAPESATPPRDDVRNGVAVVEGLGPIPIGLARELCGGAKDWIKHHGDWIVEQLPDTGGSMQWTSTFNRVYVVTPERKVVAFRPDEGPPPF